MRSEAEEKLANDDDEATFPLLLASNFANEPRAKLPLETGNEKLKKKKLVYKNDKEAKEYICTYVTPYSDRRWPCLV